MKEFIFIWNIENISYSWHKIGESIISPSFTAGPIHNSVWTLQLYPRGEFVTDYFSLYLRRGVDNGPVNLSINFEFSCISSENLPLNPYTFTEADKSFSVNSGFGHPRFVRSHEIFIKRKALYLTRDVLTLRCRMWKDEGIVKEFGQSIGRTRLPIERILLIENINPKIAEENIVYIQSKRQNKSLISISILHCEDSIRVVINPTNVEYIKFSVLKLSFYNKTIRKLLCEHVSSWLGAPRQEFWRFPFVYKMLETGNEDSVQNNVELLGEFVYSNGEEINHLENEYPYSSRLSEFVSKYIISYIPSGNLLDNPGISQNLWTLYVEHVYCDLEIKTRTTSLFVHKILLCARSPVFLAMLTGDMKEKSSECIEIDDIVDDILEKFVLFLYTDSFENLEWEVAIGLYYAADKYQVERLKILCCSYLLKNVNVDNVCELLILADRHHDSCFKSRVESFILQNDETIFSSSTWKQFVDEEPFLPAKTMILKYDKEKGKENAAETYEEKLSRHPNVQDDFVALYKGEIISDIVIKTAGASFPTHRAVLCASSSTMKEMFTKELKGNLTDIFAMGDLEDDTVSRMLLFLYANSLENVQWDTAIKLYHAADVYQIQRLKIRCSCFLLENLETSNASDLLLLAHNHRDVKLKSVVEDYIIMHDEEIFGSDAWAAFSEMNFRLANETMRSKYRKN